MNNATTPLRATRREWIGLAIIALPCLLYSMDLTVLFLALPALSADLRPSASQLLWIMDIYGFLVAGSLITMGTLGDRIGRRKLLLIGAAAFGATSILAAFSTSAEMLIISRALLGISAATLAPSTLSLIRNMFHDPQQRTFAIGVWIASFSAGGAIGPLIGGVMLAHFWWGSVFLIAVPVMILLLLLGPTLLPEYKDPNAGKLDIISALLSLLAVLSVIYGIKRIAESGVEWPYVVSILAGLLIAFAFVKRQNALEYPFLDVRLFRIPAFTVSLLANMTGIFAAFGAFLFVAQYFQLVLGMTALQAGLWTAPSGIIFVVGAMMAPWFLRFARPAHVMVMGFCIAAVGFILLSFVGQNESFPLLMTGFLLFCAGLSPVVTLTTDLIVGSAPPERVGAASAMSETGAEFGGAMGIAILGSIITAVYRSGMTGFGMQGMSSYDADVVGSTLAGAVGIAETLPAPLAAELLTMARHAFTESIELTAIICACMMLFAAIVIYKFSDLAPHKH